MRPSRSPDHQRRDSLLTGTKSGVIAEKPSEELFAVDVAGDAALSRKVPTIKRLKADEIIARRSAVPAVPMRKRPGDGKTTDGVLPAKRQKTAGYVSHKELVRLRKVADGQHESTMALDDASYDVWGTPPAETAAAQRHDDAAGPFSFLPRPQKMKAPKTMSHRPVSLAASGKPIPAVPKPGGGYSYNPTFTEYEARLAEEGAKAVAAEEKRLAEMASEQLRAEGVARSAAEAEAAEARADLSEWEEDSAWEGFESGGEELPSVKARRPERKTQAQRNRIRRRKEAEALRRHEANMRRRDAQVYRIKTIAKELRERDQALALARKSRGGHDDDGDAEDEDEDEEEENDDRLRTRRLGKLRLPEKDLELVLPDELQDSLRRLKPEGNLLKDRYRSMLVRGKVESRRRIAFHRMARKKATEKWSFKDFRLD